MNCGLLSTLIARFLSLLLFNISTFHGIDVLSTLAYRMIASGKVMSCSISLCLTIGTHISLHSKGVMDPVPIAELLTTISISYRLTWIGVLMLSGSFREPSFDIISFGSRRGSIESNVILIPTNILSLSTVLSPSLVCL